MLRKCMQLGMQAACSQLETACARSGDGPALSTGVPGVYKAPSGHPARPLLFSSCIEQVSATVGAAAEVERHGHCCGLHDAGCRALTALPAAPFLLQFGESSWAPTQRETASKTLHHAHLQEEQARGVQVPLQGWVATSRRAAGAGGRAAPADVSDMVHWRGRRQCRRWQPLAPQPLQDGANCP